MLKKPGQHFQLKIPVRSQHERYPGTKQNLKTFLVPMVTGNRLNKIFRETMIPGNRQCFKSCRLPVQASSPAVLRITVRRRLHWLTDILGSSEPINQWFEKLHDKYPPKFDPFGLRSNVCCEIYEFVAPGGYRVGPFKIELHILKLPQNIF